MVVNDLEILTAAGKVTVKPKKKKKKNNVDPWSRLFLVHRNLRKIHWPGGFSDQQQNKTWEKNSLKFLGKFRLREIFLNYNQDDLQGNKMELKDLQ